MANVLYIFHIVLMMSYIITDVLNSVKRVYYIPIKDINTSPATLFKILIRIYQVSKK